MKTAVLSSPLAAQFAEEGFAVLPDLYAPAEVAALLYAVESAAGSGPNFRRSQEIFAIRELLKEIPSLWPLLDTPVLSPLLA